MRSFGEFEPAFSTRSLCNFAWALSTLERTECCESALVLRDCGSHLSGGLFHPVEIVVFRPSR